MSDPDASDYDRGRKAGGQDAQLAEHEKRLDVINGSIVANKKAIEVQTLAIQRLSDEFAASAKATLMLAAALKDAAEAQRNTDVQAAQPTQRKQAAIMVTVAVIGVLIGVVGIYVAVRGG